MHARCNVLVQVAFGGLGSKDRCHVPGRSPLIANVMVKTVMSTLSAIGSMTLPTTVCSL